MKRRAGALRLRNGCASPSPQAAAMVLAQAGDGEAYAQILRWLAERAKCACAAAGLGPDATEAVVCDCLRVAHRARHTFDPGMRIETWADAILHQAIASCRAGQGTRPGPRWFRRLLAPNQLAAGWFGALSHGCAKIGFGVRVAERL